jgi:hypothetical protein
MGPGVYVALTKLDLTQLRQKIAATTTEKPAGCDTAGLYFTQDSKPRRNPCKGYRETGQMQDTRERERDIQMYHLLPTVLLTEKETVLGRVVRSMVTWQRNILMQLPTRKLTSEGFENVQASADETMREYETAFTLAAVEVSYWEHQVGL